MLSRCVRVFAGFHKQRANNEPPAAKNKFKRKSSRNELKRTEQILKQRKKKESVQTFQKQRTVTKQKRKTSRARAK